MAVFLICYPYNVAKSFEKASYFLLFSKRRLLGFSHHVICLTLEPAITQQRTHNRICTSVHTACGPRLRVQPRRLPLPRGLAVVRLALQPPSCPYYAGWRTVAGAHTRDMRGGEEPSRSRWGSHMLSHSRHGGEGSGPPFL